MDLAHIKDEFTYKRRVLVCETIFFLCYFFLIAVLGI